MSSDSYSTTYHTVVCQVFTNVSKVILIDPNEAVLNENNEHGIWLADETSGKLNEKLSEGHQTKRLSKICLKISSALETSPTTNEHSHPKFFNNIKIHAM